MNSNHAKRIGVFCASSRQCAPEYHQAAHRLGEVLADWGATIVYGGGGFGSMGALADGALSRGGKVIGVQPHFMRDMEWGHSGLTEMQLVDDMRERKHRMREGSAGVVALPGGCGTLEELLETITLKRLGLYLNPVILVNTRNFFDPLLALLAFAISEKFMDERHGQMWQVVTRPEDVPSAIEGAPDWSVSAQRFASL